MNETRDIKKRWQYAVLNIGNLVGNHVANFVGNFDGNFDGNFVGNLNSALVNATTLYESHRRLRIFNVQQSSQF